MIDRMEPDDKAMVITFSNASRVVQSYTSNVSILKKKVQDIEQTERSTDIREALVAASALANPGRSSSREDARDFQVAEAIEAQLHIYSDGVFPSIEDIGLGNLQAKYHPTGGFETPDNVGITAFTISNDINLSGKMQAFAQFINGGVEDASIEVSLYLEDEVVDAKSGIVVPGEDTHEIAFDLTAIFAQLESTAKVKLVIDDKDVFMQDNVAYNVINPPRPANVLVITDLNPFLRIALNTESVKKIANVTIEDRLILDDKDFQRDAQLGVYDLIVFDQCAPELMPTCKHRVD